MIANTITNVNLTSLLVPSQLPEFIRDEPNYSNFVVFLQAYYEWMELNGNVIEQTKNLLKYKDIDQTTNEFIKYFYNDFLSYFPTDTLTNQAELIKLAKKLYQSKGTPASYKLLFRILFNTDVDFLNTNDVTFKASSGSWYITKSIKISTDVIYVSNITYSGTTVTVTTTVPHYLSSGDIAVLSGVSGNTSPNGTWIVNTNSITTPTTYSFNTTEAPTGIQDFTNASIYIPNGYANMHFLDTINLRIFGETSKTIASIENALISGNNVEVFLSNIERLFMSGEYVRIVDTYNQDVLYDGQPLRGKILGQIGQINIDTSNQGSAYGSANTITGYPGDPVIIYGGLTTPTGHGASATVGTTTKGSLQTLSVINGGYGFAHNATITAPGQATSKITASSSAGGALAHVVSVLNNTNDPSTVTNIPTNALPMLGSPAGAATDLATLALTKIGDASSHPWSYGGIFPNNLSANYNTTISSALSFTSFDTGQVTSATVDNGGNGIDAGSLPTYTASCVYGTTATDLYGVPVVFADISTMGILAHIVIITGGTGYAVNDKINILGGTGYGANAKVTTTDTNGSITGVSYIPNGTISLGGNGYTIGAIKPTQNVADPTVISSIIAAGGYSIGTGLPRITVTSINNTAAGAVLMVPGIVGTGVNLNPNYNGVGKITEIIVSDYGEDYTSRPLVSLNVQDILVNGLLGFATSQLPARGDVIYQGTSQSSALFVAYVDSVYPVLANYNNATDNIFIIRVYNYNSSPVVGQALSTNTLNMNMVSGITNEQLSAIKLSNEFPGLDFNRFNNTLNPGSLIYGDGTAKASATFLNGLTIGNGQYIDSSGQPSSFNVLQSENYNAFTYQITLDKEIAKYRSTLLNLIHPIGTKLVGRCTLSSNSSIDFGASSNTTTGHTLQYYNNGEKSTITSMVANVSNKSISSNVVFITMPDITSFIVPNKTRINLTCYNGQVISSLVVGMDNGVFEDEMSENNSEDLNTETGVEDIQSYGGTYVRLQENTWVNIANVAHTTAIAGSNTIAINSITNSYNIINNGNYQYTDGPIRDIVSVGDVILIANNDPLTVSGVSNTTITTSTYISNTVTSLLSVNKTLVAHSDSVVLYGPLGDIVLTYITDELGNSLATELGSIILIG